MLSSSCFLYSFHSKNRLYLYLTGDKLEHLTCLSKRANSYVTFQCCKNSSRWLKNSSKIAQRKCLTLWQATRLTFVETRLHNFTSATLIVITIYKAKERINHSSIHDMYYQITYAATTWRKRLILYVLFTCSSLHSSPIDSALFSTDVENASLSCINEVKREIAKAQIEKAVGLLLG